MSEFRGLASINIQIQIPKFSFFEICEFQMFLSQNLEFSRDRQPQSQAPKPESYIFSILGTFILKILDPANLGARQSESSK